MVGCTCHSLCKIVLWFNSCTGKACGLPGCGKPCYIEQNGTIHDYCCKSHATAASQDAIPHQMIPPQPIPQPVPTAQTVPFAPSVPGASAVQTTPAPFTQSVPGAATNTSNCHMMSNACHSQPIFVFSDCRRSSQMCYSRVSQPVLCGCTRKSI